MSSEDLTELAKYSLTSGNLKTCDEDEESIIAKIVEVYQSLLIDSKKRRFFGLRDFIHFFTYLGRFKGDHSNVITPQAVMKSLECNFNGTKDFLDIVQLFFNEVRQN